MTMVKANFTHKLLALWLLIATVAACQSTLLPVAETRDEQTVAIGEAQTLPTAHNASTATIEVTQVAPPARVGTAMVYDSRRQVMVLFGGSIGGNAVELNDTWEYDGEQWRQVYPPQSPTRREDHLMAYDAKRGVVVLYGGDTTDETTLDEEFPDSEVLTDTWEYDGTTWHQRSFSGVTPNLYPSTIAMTYSTQEEAVVLFGARGLYTSEYETWLYDGETWTDVTTPLPENWGTYYPGLIFPSMTYDTQRQVVVLQGYTPWTHEWDGQSWYASVEAETPQAIPEDAGQPTNIVFDARRALTVMVGIDEEDPITWEYDGQQWTDANPTQSPPPRIFPPMAYDEARGVVVMFGGMQENDMMLADTWEYDGTTWTLKSEGEPILYEQLAILQEAEVGEAEEPLTVPRPW